MNLEFSARIWRYFIFTFNGYMYDLCMTGMIWNDKKFLINVCVSICVCAVCLRMCVCVCVGACVGACVSVFNT